MVDSEITASNPIGEGLDEFRRLFKSTCADLGIRFIRGFIPHLYLRQFRACLYYLIHENISPVDRHSPFVAMSPVWFVISPP
jgi:hypothetical protein